MVKGPEGPSVVQLPADTRIPCTALGQLVTQALLKPSSNQGLITPKGQ